MYSQGPRTPQFKLNSLFNEHFPLLFLFKYFVRKNWPVGGES